MLETLYKKYIESQDLFTVTVYISVCVHILTVLSFSAIPFLFQFIPYFQKYKIQKEKNNSLKSQFNVMLSVIGSQVFFQGPFIVANFYFFKFFNLSYSYDTSPSWITLTWQIIICFIIEDAWHFWAHRALHHPLLYKRFHKQHHSFTSPFALQAEYAHPFETIFTGIGFFIGDFIFCNHIVFLWAWMAARVLETTEVHSGYDFSLSPFFLLPGYAGPRYHDFHHYNFDGNYAPTFKWWDYICGTDSDYKNFVKAQEERKLKEVNSKIYYTTSELAEIRKNNRVPIGKEVTSKYSFVITGGSGMVGKKLIKRLYEEGAKKITSLDIVETPLNLRLQNVVYKKCDITDLTSLLESTKNHDVLIHMAALVGPYYEKDAYSKVNYRGCINVVEACKKNKIGVLVDCSSPSTRMTGEDILGEESSKLPYAEENYVHEYARTKALGEMEILKANCQTLKTCAIAPHQIYGEDDQLFMPNIIKAAYGGMLRIMGKGDNIVSFTHVENIAYALHVAANTLLEQSNPTCAGKFYVATDGPAQYLWNAINDGCKIVGIQEIIKKKKIPQGLMMFISYIAGAYNSIVGGKGKLNPFAARMMMNNRYFSIKEIQRDLGYEPVVKFEEKWGESFRVVFERVRKSN